MRLQLLSDLHLETETFEPQPAQGAEALVLAGDIDSTWAGLRRFEGWPVPVILVPGNHEFERRELDTARAALRKHADALGLHLLDDASLVLSGADGRRLRFVGSTRWSDFDVFGPDARPKALRAGSYFQRVMRSTWRGATFDALAVRQLGLAQQAWLAAELSRVVPEGEPGWDETVVITHFAPSLRSADPRYGTQPTTAAFCNADDGLMPGVRLWIHGHVHCRHDYVLHGCRVVSNARGHSHKGETAGFDPLFCVEV